MAWSGLWVDTDIVATQKPTNVGESLFAPTGPAFSLG